MVYPRSSVTSISDISQRESRYCITSATATSTTAPARVGDNLILVKLDEGINMAHCENETTFKVLAK